MMASSRDLYQFERNAPIPVRFPLNDFQPKPDGFFLFHPIKYAGPPGTHVGAVVWEHGFGMLTTAFSGDAVAAWKGKSVSQVPAYLMCCPEFTMTRLWRSAHKSMGRTKWLKWVWVGTVRGKYPHTKPASCSVCSLCVLQSSRSKNLWPIGPEICQIGKNDWAT